MTKDELSDALAEAGGIQYVDGPHWTGEPLKITACLDGHFTASQLQRLAELMLAAEAMGVE